MNKEEILKLLEDTYKECDNCVGGDSFFRFGDKIYYTDTPYALKGIEIFIERIKEKLNH